MAQTGRFFNSNMKGEIGELKAGLSSSKVRCGDVSVRRRRQRHMATDMVLRRLNRHG